MSFYSRTGDVSNDASFSLPSIPTAAQGWIIAGDNEERSWFTINATGTVVLTNNSSNVVANEDTNSKICLGTALAQEPLVIKNRLGTTKNIMVQLWYN